MTIKSQINEWILRLHHFKRNLFEKKIKKKKTQIAARKITIMTKDGKMVKRKLCLN